MMFEYAPAPESKDLVKFQDSYGHFIGGKFTKPSATYQTINPATEQDLAGISHGTAKDVDAAVKAARNAYEKTWSKLDGATRGKYLYRIARIIQERARELAVAETLNNGKPIKETRRQPVECPRLWFL
jgi:aldehyde dehydrogenase (NAD+)